MIENHRILRLFSISQKLSNPYTVTWIRASDLFGDQFSLSAVVDKDRIEFQYSHAAGESQPKRIWAFSIGRSPAGRARIESSQDIAPPLQSIERAREIVAGIHRQLQANPVVALSAPPPAQDLASPARPRPRKA